MKIVLLGKDGLVGSALYKLLKDELELTVFGSELEISNYDELYDKLSLIEPDVVINAAAYNNVDQAEIDKSTAYSTNSIGPLNLAKLSNVLCYRLIHYSTNFVYDGLSKTAYSENEPPKPINYYGYTKLCGDQNIAKLSRNFVIIRTSWIFGDTENNFVSWFLKNKDKEELKIVDDQVASPTYSVELAKFTKYILNSEFCGIVNYTGKGYCSKFEYIKYISEYLNLDINIKRARSSEFDSLAIRPLFAPLDLTFVSDVLKYNVLSWSDSIKEFLES